MDMKEPGKEASEDLTRESLIAISYRLPEKDPALDVSPENLSPVSPIDGINGDGAENYRSMLISISYSESPDIKNLPVSPGELKG
ncbi:Cordon-bleu protein-like [Actinidia chinensis var. chinensis]|uniref:Cordon-bleu protein-like n=1 Tax=Actinidia chinensis var. chinensis TaxID=1590841 RepID=A0A2R6RAI3_ACTCC|nr:Cordon-bleu protein-like [Actinidia chinensis var. chinensis]